MVHVEASDWVHDWWAQEREPFPYLVRVTGIPPLVAQAAFDGLRVGRCHPQQPTWWELRVPGGCLQLRGTGRLSPPPRRCYWSYREVPGTIRSGWWPAAVPVRLELVPWSETRTAVGLSVRGRPYHLASGAVYQRIGGAALEVVAAEVEAWPLHELRHLDHHLHAA